MKIDSVVDDYYVNVLEDVDNDNFCDLEAEAIEELKEHVMLNVEC